MNRALHEARAARVAAARRKHNPILPKTLERVRDKRATGAILGGLIGDALGHRYEFYNSEKVNEMIEADIAANNDFLPILGRGNKAGGELTDDGEMALGLLNFLIKNAGYDREGVAQLYIRWAQSGPPDIGMATRNALFEAKNYDDTTWNSYKTNFGSLSNGTLMRIFPLPVYCEVKKIDSKQMLYWMKEDCLITHPNPTVVEATKLYVTAVRAAVMGIHADDIIAILMQLVTIPVLKQVIMDSKYRAGPVVLESGKHTRIDSAMMGYLGIALQNALYELRHGTSFYTSLVNIARRGGDVDTNCCIAGALLGAYYGEENIPKKWVDTICNYDNPRRHNYPEANQQKIQAVLTKLCTIDKKK